MECRFWTSKLVITYNKNVLLLIFNQDIILPPFQRTNKKIYYGWVIVIISVFITFIIAGARTSFGVYFNSIADAFDLTRTTTSSIQSLYMLFCFVFTFAGGWALDKYGPKVVFLLMGLFTGLSFILTSLVGTLFHVYFSYSLLLAIGTAPFFPVINATVSKWFDKKRGVALGIATSGSRTGQAVMAPLSAYLISQFGWRYSFLITGFLAWIVVIPLSRLMKRGPKEVGALPDGYEYVPDTSTDSAEADHPAIKGLTLVQALKTRHYWHIMPTWLFTGFTTFMVYTHIVPFAIDMNISPMNASTILTIIGIVSIPSGILVGRIMDSTQSKIPMMLCIFIFAASVFSLIWAKELWHFYTIAALIGLGLRGIGLGLVTLTVDGFGEKNIGIIMASLDGCHAIGSTIGTLIGGLVFDVYGSYNLAFLCAAAGLVAANMILLFFKTESSS
jgi:MFS transporter, OFA family, oxalate/formate antiporter